MKQSESMVIELPDATLGDLSKTLLLEPFLNFFMVPCRFFRKAEQNKNMNEEKKKVEGDLHKDRAPIHPNQGS